jgi:serine phosphatase RsbU (regulator of sigma subunit)
LFVVVTDGLTETVNVADQEFSLKGIEKSIAAHTMESLPQIYEAIMHAVSDFGEQRDDRTVLLLRVLADAEPGT